VILLGLLACAVVVRLWAMPLPSSFWLDEFGTAWVTGGTLGEVLERARLFPQSLPYSAIVWAARRLFGSSEVALRAPSLVAMLAATWLVYRLGRELFDRESGLLAAGVFLLFPQIEFAAGDARPYAFAVLAATGALWMLVRWLDQGRAGAALGYVVLAAATVYFHYLFATALVAHVAYALRRRRGSPASGRQMALVAAALGLLLVPAVALAVEIGGRRASHGFGGMPGWRPLVQAAAPGGVVGLLVGCLLVCWLLRLVTGVREPPAPRRDRGDTLVLLLLASLVPAPLLFAICWMAGTHFFVLRYLMAAVASQALLLGWLLGMVEPARGRRAVLGCSLLIVLLRRGGVRDLAIGHGSENWRGAVSALNAVNRDGPVLFGGSFLEARQIDLVKDRAHAAYLRSPLDVYRTQGPAFVLPWRTGPAAEAYVADLLATIPRTDSFGLIERNSSSASWETWLGDRSRASGYEMKDVWAGGGLRVRVFRRRTPRGTG
jgi:hypothetical protein